MALAAMAWSTGAATAADLPVSSPVPSEEIVYAPAPVSTYKFIEEVRVGPSVFAIDERKRITRHEDGVFLNGEVIFGNPMTPFDNRIVDFLLRPRPHLGTTIATSGGTSQVYAGLTWDLYLTDWLFVEGTFGGTVHNGDTSRTANGPRLGCSALFRESAGIGVTFRNVVVMGVIDHSSHAGLCGVNDGLTHAGVKVGYRF